MSSFVPSGQPGDLDPAAAHEVARSFYVARMVRLLLMLIFAIGFSLASVLTGGTGWATALFGLLTLALVAMVVRTRARWRASTPPPSQHEQQ